MRLAPDGMPSCSATLLEWECVASSSPGPAVGGEGGHQSVLPHSVLAGLRKLPPFELRSKRAGLISVRRDFSLQRCATAKEAVWGDEDIASWEVHQYCFIHFMAVYCSGPQTQGQQTQFPPWAFPVWGLEGT